MSDYINMEIVFRIFSVTFLILFALISKGYHPDSELSGNALPSPTVLAYQDAIARIDAGQKVYSGKKTQVDLNELLLGLKANTNTVRSKQIPGESQIEVQQQRESQALMVGAKVRAGLRATYTMPLIDDDLMDILVPEKEQRYLEQVALKRRGRVAIRAHSKIGRITSSFGFVSSSNVIQDAVAVARPNKDNQQVEVSSAWNFQVPTDKISDEMMQKQIRRALSFGLQRVEGCWDRALLANPNARGDISLRLVISKTGTVQDVITLQDGLKYSELNKCVTSAARRIRIASQPNERLFIDVPLRFRSSIQT